MISAPAKAIPWNKGKRGIYSPEALRRMSESAHRRSSWLKGKHWSEAMRRKMSEAHRGLPTPWMFGRPVSEAMRRKLSEAHKGRIPWNKGKTLPPLSAEHRLKLSMAMTGKKHRPYVRNPNRKTVEYTPELRLRMSIAHKGQTVDEAGRMRRRLAMLGKPKTIEHRLNISKAFRGANSHFWMGGISSVNAAIKNSIEYKLWRQAVFKRDDYRCLGCGQKGGNIEADHIYPFSLFPRLRFMVENGRTLCHECHRDTPTYGHKIHQYKKQHQLTC
jgi:hypothetical protein